MSFVLGSGGSWRVRADRVARTAGAHEHERRFSRSGHVGTGTLACSRCDAPVAIGPGPVVPTDTLTCPFCSHRAAAREFLSLAAPSRPARVEVYVRSSRASGLPSP